jgi:hypothetical protein
MFSAALGVVKQTSWTMRILVLLLLAAIFSGGAIVVTGQPGFCDSCHIMNEYYDSWATSDHNEINCLECHLQPGFAGYVKGKINGLAQAVDCAVGRIGTKPNATVVDSSCLRSKCHSTAELAADKLRFNSVRFAHAQHLDKVVKGIKIGCGTCHSHFEGSEHFSVNRDVCFTCHFVTGDAEDETQVNTQCTDCHEIPNKVIQRGLVTVNHAEFVEYQASCEESCHRGQVSHSSGVSESSCLNCHSFRKNDQHDVEELHAAHSEHEKVECFACHGQILHGPTKVATVAEMIECEDCHTGTHKVQKSIYKAGDHPEVEDALTLGPMFLTHVNCTGCHIERGEQQDGVIGSIGTVAKASPAACDNCHEKGTGKQYIPFWQKRIRTVYSQVEQKVKALESRLKIESNPQVVKELKEKVQQARTILESVSSDGSWGVHNFKYTESMLRNAEQILTEDM